MTASQAPKRSSRLFAVAPKLQALIAAHGGRDLCGCLALLLHGTAATRAHVDLLWISQAAPALSQYLDPDQAGPEDLLQRSGGSGSPGRGFARIDAND